MWGKFRKSLAAVMALSVLLVSCGESGKVPEKSSEPDEASSQSLQSSHTSESSQESESSEASQNEESTEAESSHGETIEISKGSKADSVQSDSEESSQETSEEAEEHDKFLGGFLTEKITEGKFKEQSIMHDEYSFSYPLLNDDSPEAQEINKYITEEAGGFVQKQLDKIKEDDYCEFPAINWMSYRSGDMVSLVVSGYSTYHYIETFTYTFDINEKKCLTNSEIIERAGMTEEEFLTKARAVIANHFDESFSTDFEIGMIPVMRHYSIAEKGINMKCPMYFNNRGNIEFISDMATIAGAGIFNCVNELELDEKHEQKTKIGSIENVTVRLQGGKAYVYLDDHPEFSLHFGDKVKPGEEYVVNAVCDNYIDMALGIMGQNFYPTLILISDDGDIGMCDITASARAGYFSLVENLPLPKAKSVTKGLVTGGASYNTMFLYDEKGEKTDLAGIESAFNDFMPDCISEITWVSSEEPNDVYFSFVDFEKNDFAVVSHGRRYYIDCVYGGMNKDGLVYYADVCEFSAENGRGKHICDTTIFIYPDYQSDEKAIFTDITTGKSVEFTATRG